MTTNSGLAEPSPSTLGLLLKSMDADIEFVVCSRDGRIHKTRSGPLLEEAGRLACELRAQELSIVGLVAGTSVDSLRLILAAVMAGIRLVSLPAPRPSMPALEYSGLVAQCAERVETDLVVFDGVDLPDSLQLRGAMAVAELWSGCSTLNSVAVEGFEFVQHTSGTTGEPKPILLDESAIALQLMARSSLVELHEGDRLVSWLPLSHDMGLFGAVLGALTAPARVGLEHGRVVLLAPHLFAATPAIWLQYLAEQRATLTLGPAFALDLASQLGGRFTGDLSSLRSLIVGGDQIEPRVLRRFESVFEKNGLGKTVLRPAYGFAEAVLMVSVVGERERWRSGVLDQEGEVVTPAPGDGVSIQNEVVSCGVPVPGIDVFIDGEQRADGRIGDLAFRAPFLGSNLLPATEKMLSVSPGDLGTVLEGDLYVVGRTDTRIVVGGVNFSAVGIESRIEALPGIGISVAWEEDGGLRVIVEAEAASSNVDQIRRELHRCGFPRPRHVDFVETNSVKLTSSGKKRRKDSIALLATS